MPGPGVHALHPLDGHGPGDDRRPEEQRGRPSLRRDPVHDSTTASSYSSCTRGVILVDPSLGSHVPQLVEVGHQHVPVGRRAKVRVVDDAVLEGEGDPAGVLRHALLQRGSDVLRPLLEPVRRVLEHLLDLVDAGHLLLREREIEVEREVAFVRRHPGEPPAHALLVGLELLERGPREAQEGHVAVVEVDDATVEVVGQARATRTGSGIARPEHDVVRKQLGAPVEELRQRLRPLFSRQGVLLVDAHPRELFPLLRELLAAGGVRLLLLVQLLASREPLLARYDFVVRHRYPLLDAFVQAGTPPGGRSSGGRSSRCGRRRSRRCGLRSQCPRPRSGRDGCRRAARTRSHRPPCSFSFPPRRDTLASSSSLNSSSCSWPWMTPNTHQVTWSWTGVTCPGRQTRPTIEKLPSGSMWSG